MVLTWFTGILAQGTPEDSLKQILANTSDVADRIELLRQLARTQRSIDREKSIRYYSQALELVKNDPFEKAVILDTLGLYSWQSGKYQDAIEHFQEAYTIFTELQDSTWLGKVLNNIAVVNWGMGNRNEALHYYQLGLDIRRNIRDSIGVATILNNIGLIYQDWGLYDDAFTRYEEAMQIALELKDDKLIAYAYSNMGKCYELQEEYTKALDYYRRGFSIYSKEERNKYSYSLFLADIGSVFDKLGITDSALYYFRKSLSCAKEIQSIQRIAYSEHKLGQSLLTIEQVDSASKYIQSSYNKSLQNNYTELIKDNLFLLAEIEEKQGNIPLAYNYFKQASVIKDSILNEVEIGRFTELQINYKLRQEEQEKTLLQQSIEIHEFTIRKQKKTRRILLASILLILAILVLINRSRATFKSLNTKLQRSEKELKESNANKDKFFSIISHDLKSPFNVLIGIADLLHKEYDDLSEEEIKTHILLLRDTSSKAYSLLEDLLQWTKTQTGKMEYRMEPINLFVKSHAVTDLLGANASKKNITITNKVGKNTLAFADGNAVETVIRNLLSNAIKFTPGGGEIFIEAEILEQEVEFSITDTGTGMSQKVKDRIFKIEEHISTPGTNNEIGTGIGLILCKELIEHWGGKIWAHSGPGQGSKFAFTLPKPPEASARNQH